MEFGFRLGKETPPLIQIQESVLGAGFSVEILAHRGPTSAVLDDLEFLASTVAMADRRLRRRALVTHSAILIKKPPEITILGEAGWELRYRLDPRPGSPLEFIIVDREVAWVAGGSYSSKSANLLVQNSADVGRLIDHFGHMWQSAVDVLADELLFGDFLPEAEPILAANLVVVSDDHWRVLRSRLADHPEEVFALDPTAFEHLVAHLLQEMGYSVQTTPASKDGGRDILVATPMGLGDFLYLVECKRYGPDQRVGVRRVRELYGIVEQERATAGILITTSSFTRGATEFCEPVRHRLALHDYEHLRDWLDGRSPILGSTTQS